MLFNFFRIIFAVDMRKSGKKRVLVSSTEPKRHQRMVCLVSEEEAQIVQDNQQGALDARNPALLHPSQYGGGGLSHTL